MIPVDQVTAPLADHGEGPVWSPENGGLLWVDMRAGDLLTLDPGSGAVRRRNVAGFLAAVRPRAGGGLVAAVRRGFALVEPDGSVRGLGALWSDPAVRMNDGGCDPDGRFYCGTLSAPGAPPGGLYRLDPGGGATRVLDGVRVSNGLGFSPDGRTCYHTDTAAGRIDALDYEGGELRGRRPFARIPASDGAPDGLAVDAEGGVWTALWGGGAVRRYAPDGVPDAVVAVPVRAATACAFGGPDLGDLYITTSRRGADPGEAGTAGAVFRCRPGVAGATAAPFRG
ncbi:sugar lactone lactonase YvrE [Murinocardiopsis flavida]|uniref:Sugar lactone lactonase YvrE n=1 Tax=Murinocardiopsis flavida TaxID=645275 RepID=A0A2P8D6U7_9ACTN|nr:SMP-30/gluconolactonase/LRE family protein [Murinocardiopsis flavida]PSK92943.1 sugar lactone lactonase YvrE [Murinocardiopsis flavida]